MLAGFLAKMARVEATYSCCTPHDLTSLKVRFPKVDWLPYTKAQRQEAVANCDIWLGLGGTPFQSAVSSWMTDHLTEEALMCKTAEKDMYFLGIGGQDEEAFHSTQTKAVIGQSKGLWTRDLVSYEYLTKAVGKQAKITASADLSHLFFSKNSFGIVKKGRLLTCLNFDYKYWPNLEPTLALISAELSLKEQIWLIQESRSLPGAEKDLFLRLPAQEQAKWTEYSIDLPLKSLQNCISSWPNSEWALTSRFHTTLACAWAGTKTVVLDTNIKLKSAAQECGFMLLNPSASPSEITDAIKEARSANLSLLKAKAVLAEESVHAFCRAIKI
jgi:hypothetical protein